MFVTGFVVIFFSLAGVFDIRLFRHKIMERELRRLEEGSPENFETAQQDAADLRQSLHHCYVGFCIIACSAALELGYRLFRD